MNEKYVQVPVSLMEELREAAEVAYKGPNDTDPAMLRLYADKIRRGYPGGGSNLTAAVARVLDVVADALAWQPIPTAVPVRIEDMAPGTTFVGRDFDDLLSLWTCIGDGYVRSGMGSTRDIAVIDPSTIRDVQPPKDAA